MTSRELSEWIAYSIVENEDAEVRNMGRGGRRPGKDDKIVSRKGEAPALVPDHLFND